MCGSPEKVKTELIKGTNLVLSISYNEDEKCHRKCHRNFEKNQVVKIRKSFLKRTRRLKQFLKKLIFRS